MRSRIVQGFGIGVLGLCLTLAASGTCRAQQCVGDCNGDGEVEVGDLVTMANVALGDLPVSACPEMATCEPTCLPLLIEGVNNALTGCPAAAPTPTCIPLPPLTPTFTFTLEPSVLHVEDRARLSIHIVGGAPDAVYTLSARSDVIEAVGPTYQDPAGSEVDFELNAAQPGTTDVVLRVFYTFDLSSSAYCYASRYQEVQSAPFSVTVVSAGN